ncbi:hypothetical protein ACFQRL_03520 [Microbacterium fluvii]|uniref:FtsX-like permease family protein n=1 Tax=Microbacterium fluvii TaxID=415215 RepID=A0ABW2HEY8_9MICO|nr:hypothetical protein [Microbacterium fluvii]MCU4671665.1 hypothetical protein [Microbacterium fluvii]
MIGGPRFALARARAALPALLALTVVSTLAAALTVGAAASVRSLEAREVRTAVSALSADRGRVVVSTEEGEPTAAVLDAVRGVLAQHGVENAVTATVEGDGIVVAPDVGAITADDLSGLGDALGELKSAVDDVTDARVQVDGGLGSALDSIAESVRVRRGPTLVAIGMLALLVSVVMGAVAVEPVRARHAETLLLRARGARTRALAALAGAEAVVVAGVGGLVGAGLATAIPAALGGVLTVVAAPPLIALATAGALALVAAVSAAVATGRSADRRSTRAETATLVSVAVVLGVVTVLAAWRFAEAGTPVDSAGVIDPLVALAPALVLLLAALVAVLMTTPIARLISAGLRTTRGVTPITPLRLGSRRPARHALPITLVALAVGSSLVAVSYAAGVAHLGDAPEALRVGADVRITTIPDDVGAADVAAAAEPKDAAMPARSLVVRGSDSRIPLIAAQAAQLGDVMLDAGGAIDPVAISDAVAPAHLGIPLTGADLTLTVESEPQQMLVDDTGALAQPYPLDVRVAVADADGELHWFAFGTADMTTVENDDGSTMTSWDVHAEVTEQLDLGEGEWSLAAITTQPYDWFAPEQGAVITATSGGQTVDLAGFTAAPGTPGQVEAAGDGVRIVAVSDDRDRQPTRALAPETPASAPVVITRALADSMGLAEGDALSLDIDQPRFAVDAVVAAVVAVLPGTPAGEGMVVDFGTLSLLSPVELVANQVWVSSADPDAAATAVQAAFPEPVVLVADPRAGSSAAGTTVAFAVTAVGALMLAAAVLVLRRTRTRADSHELALLAVLGLGRRRAARLRAGEDLFALLAGAAAGALAGLFTAWLVVPSLVRAAYGTIPDAYPVELIVPWGAVAASVALIVAIGAVVVLTVRVPSRLAPLLREDE